ncbi:GTPase IMAP family member 7-like [Sardina pilchardus]|uniref:GTPase IMAP family member 7-like n=1 Tax=Sardina pilchardus TaxID=27697 RepID=UPI002E143C72
MDHFVIWLTLLWTMALLSAGIPLSREIRIVLLGKTGAGKSTTGNTILRRPAFEKSSGLQSVTSTSRKESGDVDGRRVTVVDTPGLFDTKIEIEKCVNLSLPGPHAFLLVIRLDMRFTEEERNTVKWFQENFSEKAEHFTIVLFTHVDQLDQSVEHTINQDQGMKEIIKKCGGRYHALNYVEKNQTSVKALLDKICTMVEENNNEYYTNKMYQDAQERMREEEERKQKEEKKKREEEEKRIREDERRKMKEEEMKKEEEKTFRKTLCSSAGAIMMGVLGLFGGPPVAALTGLVVGAAGSYWAKFMMTIFAVHLLDTPLPLGLRILLYVSVITMSMLLSDGTHFLARFFFLTCSKHLFTIR